MLRAGTVVIVFVPRDYLAAESGIDLSAVPRAVNAIFVATKADVDTQFAKAIAVGATITSPIRDRAGGLYSGYFADPEGNGWAIVWSPVMPHGPDGGRSEPRRVRHGCGGTFRSRWSTYNEKK